MLPLQNAVRNVVTQVTQPATERWLPLISVLIQLKNELFLNRERQNLGNSVFSPLASWGMIAN